MLTFLNRHVNQHVKIQNPHATGFCVILLAYLNEHKVDIDNTPMTPQNLADLVNEIEAGNINSKVAQDVFSEMITSGKTAKDIIQEKNLGQVDSVDLLEAIAKKIVESNPDEVAKYKAGNLRLFGFFVGQAMKETGGKANPKVLNDIFTKLLK